MSAAHSSGTSAPGGFGGTIGRTLAESTPWWPPRRVAPRGAPNVVVILLDDLGFSDFGCYGAEIRTPAIDALAANGVRFRNYTTVPMCTPARAALLTGRNPHAVGCGWLTFNDPGFPGYRAGEIAAEAPTLAEILRAAGYSTYAVGKWHNTAEYNIAQGADRGSWPLARGFDRFYGFIGGEAHYFSPSQLVEDNAFVARDGYPDGYFCSDDWRTRAIDWLDAHAATATDKPFFLYVAHNAPHAPLHAKPEDLARYRGVYDDGWDAIRAARHARQKPMGIVPAHWRLAPHSPGVVAWADTDPALRALYVHYMALYAALVDNVDQNIGRLTAHLAATGQLDNTLVIVTSDNGANGIGGRDGAANNLAKRLTGTEDPQKALAMLADGTLGGPASWPVYPLGWTDVSSTPFRLYKTTTMNGGIRVPLVAHWPAAFGGGGIREQWTHVTDILPTVLEVTGVPFPEQWRGVAPHAPDGASFASILRDPAAPGARTRQHYELAGNRGYIEGARKIVSLQPPDKPMNLDNWMLFDLDADATETHDLAAGHPAELAALVAAFGADAFANHVSPLDNRGVRRGLNVPPFRADAVDTPRTFRPMDTTVALAVVSPLVADRDFRVDCRFAWRPHDSGMLFAMGDPIAGLALYVREGELVFDYHGDERRVVTARGLALREGGNAFVLDYRATGGRRGRGRIVVNGEPRDMPDLSPSLIPGWVGEGLDVGCDRGQHVSTGYGRADAFAYTGSIEFVRIEPGAQAPDSYANRPERETQR
jgi:arylsulfatase